MKWCEKCEVKRAEHKCLCPTCEVVHLICESCYQEAKREGSIVDKTYNKNEISEKIVDKLK